MKTKHNAGEIAATSGFWVLAGAAGLSVVWFFTTLFLPADMPNCPPVAWWGLWPLAALIALGAAWGIYDAFSHHLDGMKRGLAGLLFFAMTAFSVWVVILVLRLVF